MKQSCPVPARRSAAACAVAAAFLALLAAPSAHASAVLDQEQPLLDADGPRHAIGGDSEQKLAQTVTVGRRGALVQVDIPVSCAEGAELTVTITTLDGSGRPGAEVLGSATVAGSELFATEPPTFRAIVLGDPPFLDEGDAFAIVLEAEGGSCGILRGPVGDAYGAGEAFFDARPNPPGWLELKGFRDSPHDLPFRTWVDVPTGGRTGFCSIPTAPPHLGGPGPVTLPLPGWTPLCRCVADRGLREARCGLFLPDLLLLRELFPAQQGEPARIRWTAIPLVDEPRVPRILESPPAGAGAKRQWIDLDEALTSLEPVSRTLTLPPGQGHDLEGWTVEYSWSEPRGAAGAR